MGESYGFTAAANWTFDEILMPFFRAGWSDGPAPFCNETATLGVIRYLRQRSNLLGLAVNWGSPVDDTLRDQVTTEAFWRIQLAQNLAFTFSIQYIDSPALNPEESSLWIGGARLRLTL